MHEEHVEKNSYECPHCGYEAKTKTQMKQHMHEEHVAKTFINVLIVVMKQKRKFR